MSYQAAVFCCRADWSTIKILRQEVMLRLGEKTKDSAYLRMRESGLIWSF